MKALIKVGYGCNDHCAFCHTLDVRHVDGEALEITAKIHRAKALGHTQVILSGGEPTIRPELVAWAELCASLGMGFGLVTNGRMLAYSELVDRLMRHRLEYVYLSLHGGTARVHDLMVRSKAFEETYGALANLSGRGLDLHVNCVVTRQNLAHLRGVVDAVRPYADATLKFSMVEPKGGGDKLFARLMPRVADVADRVRDAIEYADTLGMKTRHGAIPLCLMAGLEDRYDDLKTHAFRTMVEIGEPDFFPVDDRNKVQPEVTCSGCAQRGPCPGLYRGYHEVFGADELVRPTGGVRSNSFDYVYRTRTDSADEECPLRDGPWGVTPWDPGRDLFVRHGGRTAHFRAESRDFSDAEMQDIKLRLGQVYYDVSKKDAPDDFARDLVKLRRSDLCADCAHRSHCAGMHEPELSDRFSEDDVAVRAALAEMSGEVLDIGCGHAPYADAFAVALDAGSLSYVGIEPDPAGVAAVRAALPNATVLTAPFDADAMEDPRADHPLRERTFDHVLVLRSWNHLRDPSASARAITARTRVGGSILVVDNVAFGLARTPAQTRRAQAGSATFEHYRNDSAEDAARHFEGLPVERVSTTVVGPETSNQWVLRFRRVKSVDDAPANTRSQPNEAALGGAAE